MVDARRSARWMAEERRSSALAGAGRALAPKWSAYIECLLESGSSTSAF